MRPRTDEGSLPLAMLLMIVGAAIGGLLLTTTMQEVANSRAEAARTAALNAARSGMAGAVARIRAAVDAEQYGSVAALPCAASTGETQLSGTLDDGRARYATVITYLAEDPRSHDAAWLASHGKPCAPQLGTVPKFARLETTGTDLGTGLRRTLSGTYAFKTFRNANVPGGLMRVFKTSGSTYDLCVDAGATPAPGVAVTMQPCAVDGSGTAIARQKFGYQPNLTLSLVTADPVQYPEGLCLDGGAPESVGAVVRLQRCGETAPPAQVWSFDTASGFRGTSDGRTMNEFCLSVRRPDTPGSRLTLNSTSGGNGNPACNTNYPNNFQSWSPEPAMGAGATALAATKQLVNYAEFGRCFDVTYENVDVPYEVVFPCKQNPDPEVRDWNQRWTLPDADQPGAFYTDAPDGRYCVTMPAISGEPPLLVVVKPCTGSSPPPEMTWRWRGAGTPVYDEAYRIEGVGAWAGYCLSALPEAPAWSQADKVGIKPCTGSTLQKWNAAPDLTTSGLTGIGER
ncbi:RICIN domain-containing protein [Mangrovihabitans endophyticus]|uniref:Ricin B lectin domain-containing protein n=1 Tax=Mangrovihabitans endophyticus TaxID=1751298 RepID=A0A8J3FSF5_9ACTN|nr:ricin-type beta-trefoil lectin domain protein [Mangrovihabitans endophyticus]GGL19199.1 hypothetical protein GCM10012284_62150 [Mangrovihabitans endophyticus]